MSDEERRMQSAEQQGRILSEISSARASIERMEKNFSEFQKDIWERIGSHREEIAVLKDNMAQLRTFKLLALGAIVTAVIHAVGALVLKR